MIVYFSDVDLSRRYAVSRVTVWRWAGQGILPKPIRIGPNCTRWRADEVEAAEAKWLHAREVTQAAAAGGKRYGAIT